MISFAVAASRSETFRSYPEYKETGIKWQPKLPAHWSVSPLKRQLIRNDGGVWGDGFDPGGVMVLRSTEIAIDGSWRIVNPAFRNLSKIESQAAKLEEGDLLVTKSSGSELHIGKTAIVTRDVAELCPSFSNFMQRLRVNSTTSPNFVLYFMNSQVGREQLGFVGRTSTGLANLSASLLDQLLLPVPPLAEQRSIAAFLDRKVSGIDCLIEKKQRMIRCLEEKRTALISMAATRGLNAHAEIKESDLEWLGPIPEHWEIKPLKYLVELNPESLGEDTPSDFELQYVDIGSVGVGRLLTEPEQLTFGEAPSRARRMVRANDVIISTVRTYLKAVAQFPAPLSNLVASTGFAVLRPHPTIDPSYLFLTVSSQEFVNAVVAHSVGVSYPAINASDLVRIPVCVPPLAEQKEIADYIAARTQRIDALVAKLRQSIDRLTERRTALITAAVTGQIDVRGEPEATE